MVTISSSQVAVATAMAALIIMGSAHAGEGEECRAAPGLPLHVRLNNGVYVPRIGFGTAGLGGATEESVDLALAAGYRHIDTAQAQEWYREDAVGRALKRATARSSGEGGEAMVSSPLAVPREDVFVTTKIHPRDFGLERIRAMLETSDGNLQGVDLLLLHSPNCWSGSCPDNPTPWQDAWREFEKLYAEGATRAIGVSNFSEGLLRELLEFATVMPAAVQNWMDPFHQDKAVRALCAVNDIAYVSYSTLGGQWAYRPSSSLHPDPRLNPVANDATLARIALAHGTSRQNVALSWALQSGALVLPRSSNPGRVRDNLRVFVDVEVEAAAVVVAVAAGG